MVDISVIPIATLLIMAVSVAISFLNVLLNRLIITKMFGWQQYKSMQKELSEYNSERMKAMREKDTKTLERIKKKESQMNALQAKMMKPHMLLLAVSFIYILVWPFLTGLFPSMVAYIPGLGAQPFYIWYLLCAFFFGTIAGRIVGTTPIQ